MGESGFPVDEDFYGMVAGKLTKGSIAGGMPNIFLLVIIGWLFFRAVM